MRSLQSSGQLLFRSQSVQDRFRLGAEPKESVDGLAFVVLATLSARYVALAVRARPDATGVAIWGQSHLANQQTSVAGNILGFDLLMHLS